MFKTIDSLLEFTNGNKVQEALPKQLAVKWNRMIWLKLLVGAKETQNTIEIAREKNMWNKKRRKDENRQTYWWIVSRTMKWRKINATNNKIPVNRSECRRCVFVPNSKTENGPWHSQHTHTTNFDGDLKRHHRANAVFVCESITTREENTKIETDLLGIHGLSLEIAWDVYDKRTARDVQRSLKTDKKNAHQIVVKKRGQVPFLVKRFV